MAATVLGSYTVWECARDHRKQLQPMDWDAVVYCGVLYVDPATDRYETCGQRMTRIQAVEITL